MLATTVAALYLLALVAACAAGSSRATTPLRVTGSAGAGAGAIKGNAPKPKQRAALVRQPLIAVTRQIEAMRERTWGCQDMLGVRRTKASQARIGSARYGRYVLRLWLERSRIVCGIVEQMRVPAVAIKAVFQEHADEALRVFACESGDSYSTTARNGQYQGLAQMGSSERARFGHGDTALEQVRAAYRYFLVSGWRPWSCARIVGVI